MSKKLEISVLDRDLKRIGILNNAYECITNEVLNSEYTMKLSCVVEAYKSPLLYDSNNIIAVDDEYYKVFKIRDKHQAGELLIIECECEHVGYEIIQEIFEDGFKMSGTVQAIGDRALAGTRFKFITDCTDFVEIDISGITNARQVIDKLCQKCNLEAKWSRFTVSLMSDIGQNTIRVEFGNNCDYVERTKEMDTGKVTYSINLLDSNDEQSKELRRCHLGDTILINDKELGIKNIQKKVVAIEDDKITKMMNSNESYEVMSFDKTIPTATSVILGDIEYDLEEEINNIIDIPTVKIDNTQLTEVIEEKVIVAEVAMIQNCWINELSVEFLETNFTDLDTRQPYPEGGIRNFFRIHDEIHEHVTQELSDTETEDYKTPSGKQIYWTAIGDNAQAYKYFTITPPEEYNPELTPQERAAFKVQVRKVISETVKLSTNFEQLTDSSNDIVPCMIWGAGNGGGQVSPQYQTVVGKTLQCGQALVYKSRKGLVLRYFNTDGKMYQVVIGEDGVEINGKKIDIIEFFNDGFGFNKQSYFQWLENGNIKRLSDNTIIQINDRLTESVLDVFGGDD